MAHSMQQHAPKNFIMTQFAHQDMKASIMDICALQRIGCPHKGGADKDFSPHAPAMIDRCN
jgi:hypothetical protein